MTPCADNHSSGSLELLPSRALSHATGMTKCEPDTAKITDLLLAVSNGERDALDQLVPVVYDHLRRIAGAPLRREIPGHSLQPTALVHEAYLRLVDQRQVHWRNRAHFFGVAASLMRRITVDHSRAPLPRKRGGGIQRATLHGDEAAATAQSPPRI